MAGRGRGLAAAALCAVLAAGAGKAGGRHVAYRAMDVRGVTAHVLQLNMNEPVRVSVTVARGFPAGDEPFASMVKRSEAEAAINGTFFGKDNLRPIGDIVVEGRQIHWGRMGTVLAIAEDNRVEIRRVPWGRTQDWSGRRTVLGCGPTLLRDGEIDLDPRAEGFRDPHVLGAGARSAAGVTPANKLLLVSVPRAVTLARLAALMKELGCVHAMNLDGGASVAMYYRGRMIVPAGRALTNILTVREE